MPLLVSLREVALFASSLVILEPITLSLEAGECIGVVGHNGGGKTTLLRVLATLAAPSAGAGEVLGAALGTREVLSVRNRIGLVGHQPALIPALTLRENLAFYARLGGIGGNRVDNALTIVGLARASDRRVADCSAGMKKRADLARLLLHPPELLLLDEPADTLDRSARSLVDHLVSTSLDRGGAAIVVSHDRANLVDSVHRVHSLDNGKLT